MRYEDLSEFIEDRSISKICADSGKTRRYCDVERGHQTIMMIGLFDSSYYIDADASLHTISTGDLMILIQLAKFEV